MKITEFKATGDYVMIVDVMTKKKNKVITTGDNKIDYDHDIKVKDCGPGIHNKSDFIDKSPILVSTNSISGYTEILNSPNKKVVLFFTHKENICGFKK